MKDDKNMGKFNEIWGNSMKKSVSRGKLYEIDKISIKSIKYQ